MIEVVLSKSKEVDEPLLMKSTERFTLFPIKYDDVSM